VEHLFFNERVGVICPLFVRRACLTWLKAIWLSSLSRLAVHSGTDLQSDCRASKSEKVFAIVRNFDDERAESKAKRPVAVREESTLEEDQTRIVPALTVPHGFGILEPWTRVPFREWRILAREDGLSGGIKERME